MASELHRAAERGNLNRVKELLNQGANIHALDRYGRQPIHWAARGGHLQIVKFLLNRGAKVNVRDKGSNQPIHFAANRGHLNVVKELLNRGAYINSPDFYGNTPLHIAAKAGKKSVAKELIRLGASTRGITNSRQIHGILRAALKKYIEDLNVYRALIIKSMAKGPLNNTKPYYPLPNAVPINALIKTIRKKSPILQTRKSPILQTRKRPRNSNKFLASLRRREEPPPKRLRIG